MSISIAKEIVGDRVLTATVKLTAGIGYFL